MGGTTPTALVLAALLSVAAGCGGGGGGDGGSGSIEGCLEDAGLNVRSRDINSVDSELVAAGAEQQFIALDLDQQEYTYEVLVFEEAAKADAYARKQQAEYDEQPSLKFQIEAEGKNAYTTTSDAPKRDDVSKCAADAG